MKLIKEYEGNEKIEKLNQMNNQLYDRENKTGHYDQYLLREYNINGITVFVKGETHYRIEVAVVDKSKLKKYSFASLGLFNFDKGIYDLSEENIEKALNKLLPMNEKEIYKGSL